jgi:Holliday junction DNA helicase RuvA
VIAFLRGKVQDNDGETAIIDVGGVGYQVFVSASTGAGLPPVGQEASVFVHSHFVTDEPLRLYGFTDAGERHVFKTLILVQGVSPRIALAMLTGLERVELVRAIATGEVGRLTQIKGVGRKIAERMVLELREKILEVSTGRPTSASPPASASAGAPRGPLGDVHGALLQLGYKQSEIEPLFEKMDAARPVADLVRDALSALRRK